jgi:hypothetical protein
MTAEVIQINAPRTHRKGRVRPITTYYFRRGQLRPLRISRSTSVEAALRAVVTRIQQGEPIWVAEIINAQGRLLRTATVRYRSIIIK